MAESSKRFSDAIEPVSNSGSELPTIQHHNLSNTVFMTLCDALIKGRFEPGERLRIRKLAEQLGVSVTPVRDALLKLIQDDALILRSPKDIRIPIITRDSYLEIREIRLKLEALAAERAAQVATPADIEILKDLIHKNEKAMARNDRLEGLALNQAFHFQLPKIAKMPILHGTLKRLWLQMGPLIARSYLDGGREMIDFHYPVADAIFRHDPEAASQAIMDDILHGGRAILNNIPESEEN
ncbi:MAG: GntR family transcriptional regulator [Rhodovibrionaceae bacterium]